MTLLFLIRTVSDCTRRYVTCFACIRFVVSYQLCYVSIPALGLASLNVVCDYKINNKFLLGYVES